MIAKFRLGAVVIAVEADALDAGQEVDQAPQHPSRIISWLVEKIAKDRGKKAMSLGVTQPPFEFVENDVRIIILAESGCPALKVRIADNKQARVSDRVRHGDDLRRMIRHGRRSDWDQAGCRRWGRVVAARPKSAKAAHLLEAIALPVPNHGYARRRSR